MAGRVVLPEGESVCLPFREKPLSSLLSYMERMLLGRIGPGLCSRFLSLIEPFVHRGLEPQHSPLDSRLGGVGVKGKEGEWPRGPMEIRGQDQKTPLSDKPITILIIRKGGFTLGL